MYESALSYPDPFSNVPGLSAGKSTRSQKGFADPEVRRTIGLTIKVVPMRRLRLARTASHGTYVARARPRVSRAPSRAPGSASCTSIRFVCRGISATRT